MSEHQPTPWRVAGGMNGAAGCLASNGDGYVRINTPFVVGAWIDKHGGATPEALANAAFIVRAVNSHDELLAACEAAADSLDCSPLHALMIEVVRKAKGNATP